MADDNDIHASFNFMKQVELYDKVKPYSIDNEIKKWDGPIPRTNYRNSVVEDVVVKDLRGREGQFTFEKNGFAVIELDSSMAYEDYSDPVKLYNIYLQEVAACLIQYFSATSVHIFNVVVSICTRLRVNALVTQVSSASSAASRLSQSRDISSRIGDTAGSTDSTPDSLDQLVRELKQDQLAIGSRRYIYLNVWKTLVGPLYDWPLAFCDAETIEPGDLQSHDQVFHDVVRENVMVYHNPDQKWYYLSGQMPSELLLFRQADSQNNPGVAHTAFEIPSQPPNPLQTRESIEIRVVVYLD
ncbi:hypothetical protein FE257_008714 [Aspergillus nanangensis]|uniref:Uncharacterized protein n=1 Tax=Aspergillus nanangensis TaxID=2582783 RepID=A0AAD4CL49_ASPNN|nr:hypothetical protein FE257_008714 [Aspergillus nanangensis]